MRRGARAAERCLGLGLGLLAGAAPALAASPGDAPLTRRPLLPAAGGFELGAAASLGQPPLERTSLLARIGLTDRVALELPLGLALGLSADDGRAALVRAGLLGLDYASGPVADADPRQPDRRRRGLYAQVGAGGAVRLPLDEAGELALLAAAKVARHLSPDAAASGVDADAALTLLYSPAPWITLAPGISLAQAVMVEGGASGVSEARRAVVMVGGVSGDGYVPAGLVALHPLAWLDVGVGPGLQYDLLDRKAVLDALIVLVFRAQ